MAYETSGHVCTTCGSLCLAAEATLTKVREIWGPGIESIEHGVAWADEQMRAACDRAYDLAGEVVAMRAVVDVARTVFPPDAGMWDSPRMKPIKDALAALDALGVIDRLYEELRQLARATPTPEREVQYQRLVERLEVLEDEDARRLERHLATTGPLKPGEVSLALQEAREMIAKYEKDDDSKGGVR